MNVNLWFTTWMSNYCWSHVKYFSSEIKFNQVLLIKTDLILTDKIIQFWYPCIKKFSKSDCLKLCIQAINYFQGITLKSMHVNRFSSLATFQILLREFYFTVMINLLSIYIYKTDCLYLCPSFTHEPLDQILYRPPHQLREGS